MRHAWTTAAAVLLLAGSAFAQDGEPRRLVFPDGEAVVSVEVEAPRFASRSRRLATGYATAHLADGTEVLLHVRRTRRGRQDRYRLASFADLGPVVRCRFRVPHAAPDSALRVRVRLPRWETRAVYPELPFSADLPEPPVVREAWTPRVVPVGVPFERLSHPDPDRGYVTDLAIRDDGHLVVLGTWHNVLVSGGGYWPHVHTGLRWEVTPDGEWVARRLGPHPAATADDRPRVLSPGGRFAAGLIDRPRPPDGRICGGSCLPDPDDAAVIWGPDEMLEFGAGDLTYLPASEVVALSRASSLGELTALIRAPHPDDGTWDTFRWRADGSLRPLGRENPWGTMGRRAFFMSDDGSRVLGVGWKNENGVRADIPVWWDADGVQHVLAYSESVEFRMRGISGCGRWVAASTLDSSKGTSFYNLVWDLDHQPAPPVLVEEWEDWNPAVGGLEGGEITDIARGGIAVGANFHRHGFLWMPGWKTTRPFRAWAEEQGVDTSAWTRLRLRSVSADDDGIAFAGEGERPDGTWQLFVAFVPNAE